MNKLNWIPFDRSIDDDDDDSTDMICDKTIFRCRWIIIRLVSVTVWATIKLALFFACDLMTDKLSDCRSNCCHIFIVECLFKWANRAKWDVLVSFLWFDHNNYLALITLCTIKMVRTLHIFHSLSFGCNYALSVLSWVSKLLQFIFFFVYIFYYLKESLAICQNQWFSFSLFLFYTQWRNVAFSYRRSENCKQ